MAGKDQHEQIHVDNLLINLHNPRFEATETQIDALKRLAKDQGVKLINLAEDIAEKGLSPSDLPIVGPPDAKGNYIVLEGNRRIAALKLLESPSLAATIGISAAHMKKLEKLHDALSSQIPETVFCAVLTAEEARHWILLRHTRSADGVSIDQWDSIQAQRFRGSSPTLQAINAVENSSYIDEELKSKLFKISTTNVERVINTPEARKHLGVDIQEGRLVFIGSAEKAIARLSVLVKDVATKKINVTDIETREDRIEYARKIASRPLPKPIAKSKKKKAAKNKKQAVKPLPVSRNTVIPRNFKVAISHTRINNIYDELRKLRVDEYPNACAVLLRVFLELSMDEYASKKHIVLKKVKKGKPPKDMTLREKIVAVADFLENHSISTKSELKGIRTIANNKNHILSVDILNAYVHNSNFNPNPDELKHTWDNAQVFVDRILTT